MILNYIPACFKKEIWLDVIPKGRDISNWPQRTKNLFLFFFFLSACLVFLLLVFSLVLSSCKLRSIVARYIITFLREEMFWRGSEGGGREEGGGGMPRIEMTGKERKWREGGCVKRFPSLNFSAIPTGLPLYVQDKLRPGRNPVHAKHMKASSMWASKRSSVYVMMRPTGRDLKALLVCVFMVCMLGLKKRLSSTHTVIICKWGVTSLQFCHALVLSVEYSI